LTRKSSFEDEAKANGFKGFGADRLGQNCPQEYPQSEIGESIRSSVTLGEPLSIGEVARLVGCSVWTVRQRYLPAGLPHLRMRPNGKLIFFRNQVVNWLLTEQQKGGITI
jgi:hypothetical protein